MGKEKGKENSAENRGKSTAELINELSAQEISLETYLEENADIVGDPDLKKHWHGLVEKSGLSSFDIINRSEFAYTYYYEVIGGKKIPSRDKVIRLVLAMHLPLEECSETLRICGLSELYPRFKRDSIIIYGIKHGLTVFELNELLNSQKERELR